MDIRQVSAPEAHQLLQEHPDAVYLDVRTPTEFEAEHPTGARNVPVVFFQPGGPPAPNPDFVAVVERSMPRDTKLMVGCQAGGRSQRAAELLTRAGWTDVHNVQGGFGGARDETGRLIVPGWRESGLPVERGATPGATYADLASKK
jgi:rhodanese-related sulfurtransferase